MVICHVKSPTHFLLLKRCIFQKGNDIPVITVPVYMQSCMQDHEKKKRNLLRKNEFRIQNRGDVKTPVITSRHIPQFNFYLNQKYPQIKEVPLASLGWKNGKHKGDEIIFHPRGPNPHFVQSEGLNYDFSATSLSPLMVKVLNQMNYHRPTSVQLQAIPEILNGQNVMCSAETGCGKTLAYLAPVIDKISRHKEHHGELKPRYPYAMIVLPSRELVYQIGMLAKEMGSLCGVGVAPIVGGCPGANKDVFSHSGYDLVLTTAGLIEKHMKYVYCVDEVRSLVLDEADTLLDDSFSYDVWDLINDLKFKSAESRGGSQLCLVSATIPRHLEEKLGDFVDVDSFFRVHTSNVHQVQPHVKHVFIRMHKFDRSIRLLELLSHKIRQKRRIMIFCNDRKTCKWLYHYLLDNQIETILLSKAVGDEDRLNELERFQRGEVNVCVSSDLGSRGIDVRNVTDVVNYDCPVWVADYIHRAGRTGRVGSSDECCVTSFVCFKPAVDVLNQLEYSLRTYSNIPFVDGNIKKSRKDKKIHQMDPITRKKYEEEEK